MTHRRVAERAGAVATALVVWLLCAGATLAASPTPEVVVGDPRSSGQGPGLVGDPLSAVLAVVVIGVGAVVATLVYVRLTARRGG
jgi:hypothetical protein